MFSKQWDRSQSAGKRSGNGITNDPWIMRDPFVVVLLAVTALLASPAFAQDLRPDNGETPRGLAMGTGARASAASTSAIYYNPANLPLGRLYHLEGVAGYDPGAGRWSLGAAVVDSMTSSLAAGLAFRGILGDGGYSGIDGRLAIGLPLGDVISLGVAGRYVSIQENNQGGDDDEAADLAQGFTMDASLRVTPTDGFHLLGFVQNLVDLGSTLAPVLVGGGASIQIGDELVLAGDAIVDLSTFDHAAMIVGGGAEYLAAGKAPIRLGYRFDFERDVHTLTGGVGYVDQSFGIDLAVSRDVSGADDTRLMAGIRYFVH